VLPHHSNHLPFILVALPVKIARPQAMAMTAVVLAGRRGRCHNVENLREGIRRKLVEIGRWYCAAFGGAPHQSSSGSEEPLDDSFSPRGEAFVPYRSGFVLLDSVEAAPKASP